MITDEIVEAALAAYYADNRGDWKSAMAAALAAVLPDARRAERERCAETVETWVPTDRNHNRQSADDINMARDDIAAAIRALEA